MEEVLNRHRGPYVFCVTRPGKKAGFFSSEWLKGEVSREDVVDEAQALLSDPRDTILSVGVWSVREQQFIGSIK